MRAERDVRRGLEAGHHIHRITGHEGDVGPVQRPGQCVGYDRGGHASHPRIYRIEFLELPVPWSHDRCELSKGLRAYDHALLRLIVYEATIEEFRSLLAPVATPVAVLVGAEAVDGRKDVPGVGRAHLC